MHYPRGINRLSRSRESRAGGGRAKGENERGIEDLSEPRRDWGRKPRNGRGGGKRRLVAEGCPRVCWRLYNARMWVNSDTSSRPIEMHNVNISLSLRSEQKEHARGWMGNGMMVIAHYLRGIPWTQTIGTRHLSYLSPYPPDALTEGSKCASNPVVINFEGTHIIERWNYLKLWCLTFVQSSFYICHSLSLIIPTNN